jgi:hypothetical protein
VPAGDAGVESVVHGADTPVVSPDARPRTGESHCAEVGADVELLRLRIAGERLRVLLSGTVSGQGLEFQAHIM